MRNTLYTLVTTLALTLFLADWAQCQPTFFDGDSTPDVSLPSVKDTATASEMSILPEPKVGSYFTQPQPTNLGNGLSFVEQEHSRFLRFLATSKEHSWVDVPLMIERSNQQYLVARWTGHVDLTGSITTELLLFPQLAFLEQLERPSDAHVDLAWNGEAFELRQYTYYRPTRCSSRPRLVFSRSYAMHIAESSSQLVLTPVYSSLAFPFAVHIDRFRRATLSTSFPSLDLESADGEAILDGGSEGIGGSEGVGSFFQLD